MASRVWLVTGCSSGFGEAFVREILARGDKVIATARNADQLLPLKRLGAFTLTLDVTSTVEDLKKFMDTALKVFGRIDILVNNAGYVYAGAMEETQTSEELAVFQTNFFGALNVTRAILPHMRARKSGTIIFVSSVAAWEGLASFGAYSATKAALSAYTESLRDELAEFGIQVASFEPGYFRSNLLASRNLQGPSKPMAEYDGSKARKMQTGLDQVNQKQIGDVDKGTRVMVDIITGTGVAKGRQLPVRLVLGSDAYQMAKGICEKNLATFDTWRDVIVKTDHE